MRSVSEGRKGGEEKRCEGGEWERRGVKGGGV